MMARLVICPPIQSIVVVTSPMGDHTPPEFAAMTTMPANISRSSCLWSNLRIKDTITMVVVKLSRIALRKNVTVPTSQIKPESLTGLMRAVITSNPLCASMTTTMVIAAIRKRTICAVAINATPSCPLTRAPSSAHRA
jgi:hypothetical protein